MSKWIRTAMLLGALLGTHAGWAADAKLVISQVSMVSQGSQRPAETRIVFDPSSTPASLLCSPVHECFCRFSWYEGEYGTQYVYTPVDHTRPDSLMCLAPKSKDGFEVGSVITISVVRDPGAIDSDFSCLPYNFLVTPSATAGSFQDDQGTFFDNIFHYRCVNKYNTSIVEDFFTRDSERGVINLQDPYFACSVDYYHPERHLEFALSMDRTSTYIVPVEAATVLGNGSPYTGIGFVHANVGYALRPNQDGSCPSFRDSQGHIRLTYHLRKFAPYLTGHNPIYRLDFGNGVPVPYGYIEDVQFRGCAAQSG